MKVAALPRPERPDRRPVRADDAELPFGHPLDFHGVERSRKRPFLLIRRRRRAGRDRSAEDERRSHGYARAECRRAGVAFSIAEEAMNLPAAASVRSRRPPPTVGAGCRMW